MPMLSDVLCEAATHAGEAHFMDAGDDRDDVIGRMKDCWTEAETKGFYYQDDLVTSVGILMLQTYLDADDIKELISKLNILVRCATWVEQGQRPEWD